MSSERIIQDSLVQDERWRDAADNLEAAAWFGRGDYVVGQLADGLASEVEAGDITKKELRKGVSWLRILDAEAAIHAGGDISSLEGSDWDEAITRRVAYVSGRQAVKSVGTKFEQRRRAMGRERRGMRKRGW